MKQCPTLIKTAFFATFFLLCSFKTGATNTFQTTKKSLLTKQMEKAIKQSGIASHHIGVITVNSANQTLYQLNTNKFFIPASLIKIGTAGALLDLLPPSQTFTTRFMAHTKIKNAILKGSLYLKGGGDPGFVSESLWNLVNNLKRTGLKTVQGDLIVDDSRFDTDLRGPRLKNPSHSSYDAPISALSFNWNTVNIYLRPNKKKGLPLHLNIDPSPLYFTEINNQTMTSKTKNQIVVQRKHKKPNRESLTVKGQMPLNAKEILIYKNILHPAIWTGWNAIAFLKQRGIHVKGEVKKGKTPNKADVLAEWQSQPLTDQIKLMMKYSNNFMVEMLVKNLAVELTSQTGQLKTGIEILKKYLQKKDFQEYVLVQPSGLSRQNKIKPRHLIEFLQYWQGHPLQAEFESAFPLANEDGTLKTYFIPKRHAFSVACTSKHLSPLSSTSGILKCNRYNNSILKGHLRAKTASINGVTGLAGYLTTKTKEKKTFVFIFNGPPALTPKAKKLFQTLLSLMIEEKATH